MVFRHLSDRSTLGEGGHAERLLEGGQAPNGFHHIFGRGARRTWDDLPMKIETNKYWYIFIGIPIPNISEANLEDLIFDISNIVEGFHTKTGVPL